MDFSDNNLLTNIESINTSISNNGFSEYTIQLIDNYISKILNGKTNLTQFNQPSMQASALQVRCSSGRTSYATTREQALKQVQMLQQAKQAQQTGK